MNTYSQNAEDLFVLDYFKSHKGYLLDIGANDGTTFSNSRLLIEQRWKACLVEPGAEFEKLIDLYDGFPVKLYNYGIGEKTGNATFYQSGAHVKNGSDSGLVSTFNISELSRWPDVEFKELNMAILSFNAFWECTGKQQFDFISIDTEGFDWIILKQIDLDEIGCRCLCIEWNGNAELRSLYTDYCATFGLKMAKFNAENLIFTK